MRGCWIVVKRKRKNEHWQCDEEVQNVEEKFWKNEELRNAEEALPRLKECHLEEVSRLYKAKTGVGCDGFQPSVSLDLTKETSGEIVEFLEKVEQSGKWPQKHARRCYPSCGYRRLSCWGRSGVAPLKLRVFVDDITALLRRKNKVVAEMAKKVMKKLKEEVERKGQ